MSDLEFTASNIRETAQFGLFADTLPALTGVNARPLKDSPYCATVLVPRKYFEGGTSDEDALYSYLDDESWEGNNFEGAIWVRFVGAACYRIEVEE